MTISGVKRCNEQPLLWEVPLGNHGHSRNVIGQLAEELTAAYVGGRRHKSDSTKDYCPDVSAGNRCSGTVLERLDGSWKCVKCGWTYDCPQPNGCRTGTASYFESKAVGQSNQAFVYAGRLEKDRRFAQQRPLNYVIWSHSTTVKGVETVEQLRRLMLASIRKTYMLSFEYLDAVCQRLTPEPLNSKYGGSDERPEYGSGYRIALSLIEHCVVNNWPNGLSEEMVRSWNRSA